MENTGAGQTHDAAGDQHAQRNAGGGGFDAACLVSPTELPSFEKYDEYVPAELLRHAYATDRLNAEDAAKRLRELKEDKSFY